MEIHRNSALVKCVTEEVDGTVDRLLTDQITISENTELGSSEFDEIIDTIMQTNEIQSMIDKYVADFDLFETAGNKPHTMSLNFEKLDLYDDNRLENLLKELQQIKSPNEKHNLIKELIKCPLLDLTDKDKWVIVSKILRDCLIGANLEMFELSLKTHIQFSYHIETIIDATINLLKTLTTLIHGKKGLGSITKGIDMKNTIQEHIIKITDLFLTNFAYIIKNFTCNRDKMVEVCINNFMELITFHINIEKKNVFNFLHYVSVLDPSAKWFRQLMYSCPNRILILTILNKNSNFLKYLITELISTINTTEPDGGKLNLQEIHLDVLKIAIFNNYLNILTDLLTYKECHQLFPIEILLTEKPLTTVALLNILITSINNLYNVPKQKIKRDILVKAVTQILMKQRHFLDNKEISETFIKPLINSTFDKHRLVDVALKNNYIFPVITEIASMKDGFLIIFGYKIDAKLLRKYKSYHCRKSLILPEPLLFSSFFDKTRKRPEVTIGKAITEFSITMIRRYVHIYDKLNQLDAILLDIFECCSGIYSCHTHVYYLVDSPRLISISIRLFKLLTDRNIVQNKVNPILKFLMIICGSKTGLDFVDEDPQTVYTLCQCLFTLPVNLWNERYFCDFFYNVSQCSNGIKAIGEARKQLISSYLEKIWMDNEDELIYISGSSRKCDVTIMEFAKIIYAISFSFKCAQELISNETDDDSTLVEDDQEIQASNLRDLIEDTLSYSGPATLSCHIGLLTIRILINNINILLYLQHTFKLQDQLEARRDESMEDNDSSSQCIVDECGLMRQDLIDYIKSVGIIKQNQCTAVKISKEQRLHSSATPSARKRKLNELQRFLYDSRNNLHDAAWLMHARKIFLQNCGEDFKENMFLDLIQHVRLTIPNSKNYFVWPDQTKLKDLFPEDHIGVLIIIQFGINKTILQPTTASANEENLKLLLKQVYAFLNVERDKFDGFDWFVGVIFLICFGNIDRCKTILQSIVHLPATPYIWPVLREQLRLKSKIEFAKNFDHALNILVDDLEIFNPALESSFNSWNAITRNWINQCFFQVMEWNDICNFIAMAIIFPPEYVLFFLMCAAQHLTPFFMNAIVCNEINKYHNLQLNGFRLCDWMTMMEQMSRQYKNECLIKY